MMDLNQQGTKEEKALIGNEWCVLASKSGGEKGKWWKAWRWLELGKVERGVYTWLKIRSALPPSSTIRLCPIRHRANFPTRSALVLPTPTSFIPQDSPFPWFL